MRRKRRRIDATRASRAGHQFHDTWAARQSLQLLLLRDGLVGIAVEGLEPADTKRTSAETAEIADLTLYYGNAPNFAGAKTVRIVQFKYSISKENIGYRASDARKTIRKFATALADHKAEFSASAVSKKLQFELITNRPVLPAFREAIAGLASGKRLTGETKRQADQFKAACRLRGKELASFAAQVAITGMAGSVGALQRDLKRIVADWSAARDALSRARLGDLKELIAKKAGLAGQDKNLITQIDLVDALGLQETNDLFPCPDAFPKVGRVVKREQLNEIVTLVPTLDKPLLLHAEGGVGKTVFLQSLVGRLSRHHVTVLFDCFGGGEYRAIDDGRHLPKRGLIHIVNTLAARGLCDPLLPDNESPEDVIAAFRRRLQQAYMTLSRAAPQAEIVLVLDAIDNAAEQARDTGQSCFPRLLLASLEYRGPIDGVKVVVSCRSHRRSLAVGDVVCEQRELRTFSKSEAESYLKPRVKRLTATEIKVAYARSGGNARILEHLATSDRGLLDASEIDKEIKLPALIQKRIATSLRGARQKGYKEETIKAFLAGLAVLPPPVPVREYAN